MSVRIVEDIVVPTSVGIVGTVCTSVATAGMVVICAGGVTTALAVFPPLAGMAIIVPWLSMMISYISRKVEENNVIVQEEIVPIISPRNGSFVQHRRVSHQ